MGARLGGWRPSAGNWALEAWALLLTSLVLLCGEKACPHPALLWDKAAASGDIAIRTDSVQILFISLLCPRAYGLLIILVFIFQTFLYFASKCKKAALTSKIRYSKEQEKAVGVLGRENTT